MGLIKLLMCKELEQNVSHIRQIIKTHQKDSARLVTPGPVRNISAVRLSVGNTFKMLIEYLPPLEDGGGRYTVYRNELCRYHIKSNMSMNCTTKETPVMSYITEKQLADTTYKVTIYVKNEAKLEGPPMEYIYTTPSHKKPTVRPSNDDKTESCDLEIIGLAGTCVACACWIIHCYLSRCFLSEV